MVVNNMQNKDLVITGLDWQTIYNVSEMLLRYEKSRLKWLKRMNMTEETNRKFMKEFEGVLAFNNQLMAYLKENKPSAE